MLLGCSLSFSLLLLRHLFPFPFFFRSFPFSDLPSAIKSLFDARSSTPSAPPGSAHWFIRLDTKTRGAGL
uniref:Putative secreted protein n=1 Tax=Anopheles darlingi TaxID=43151 RepID=A0A2M4DNN3_ANODA